MKGVHEYEGLELSPRSSEVGSHNLSYRYFQGVGALLGHFLDFLKLQAFVCLEMVLQLWKT